MNMPELLWRVHWKSPLTGATGFGAKGFPREQAAGYARYQRDAELTAPASERLLYWIEPEIDDQKQESKGE
jgi:hypothetical protein